METYLTRQESLKSHVKEIPSPDPHDTLIMDIKIIAQDILETLWDLAQEPTLLRDEFLSLMRKRE